MACSLKGSIHSIESKELLQGDKWCLSLLECVGYSSPVRACKSGVIKNPYLLGYPLGVVTISAFGASGFGCLRARSHQKRRTRNLYRAALNYENQNLIDIRSTPESTWRKSRTVGRGLRTSLGAVARTHPPKTRFVCYEVRQQALIHTAG